MSCSAIMAVVYILGVSPADETAVCFGTEESGAFAPAAFEERRHSEIVVQVPHLVRAGG